MLSIIPNVAKKLFRSKTKTTNGHISSDLLKVAGGFASGVAVTELKNWFKEAFKYKPKLNTIIKDFEVCEMLDSIEIKSLEDLMSLDPDRPIARCYKYDPLNKKHATNQDENLITVNDLIKKMFSGKYVLSEGKLFFDNFSDIVTVLNHFSKLYNCLDKEN